MDTETTTVPEVPGMEHVGWTCRHSDNNPDDVHTEWAQRRHKPGWKRKKRPGVVSSMSVSERLWWGADRPEGPGCLAARPVYAPI